MHIFNARILQVRKGFKPPSCTPEKKHRKLYIKRLRQLISRNSWSQMPCRMAMNIHIRSITTALLRAADVQTAWYTIDVQRRAKTRHLRRSMLSMINYNFYMQCVKERWWVQACSTVVVWAKTSGQLVTVERAFIVVTTARHLLRAQRHPCRRWRSRHVRLISSFPLSIPFTSQFSQPGC